MKYSKGEENRKDKGGCEKNDFEIRCGECNG